MNVQTVVDDRSRRSGKVLCLWTCFALYPYTCVSFFSVDVTLPYLDLSTKLL